MSLTFVPDAGGIVPRDEAFEAVDALRGYAWQFLHVVRRLLEAPAGTTVYVEVFEDILTVLGNKLRGEQLKDRAASFSITQQPSCEMLERWAVLAAERSEAEFVFLSTQSAGPMHDGSKAFADWTDGNMTSQVRELVRASLASYLKRPTKENGAVVGAVGDQFPLLSRIVADAGEFDSFWSRIEWRLEQPGASDIFESLVKNLMAEDHEDESAARTRLFAWIGAIAWSATRKPVAERAWTIQKLRDVSPTDPRTGAGLFALLVGMGAHNAAVLEKLDELRRMLGSQSTGWSPIAGAFARSARLDDAARRADAKIDAGSRLVVLVGRAGDGKTQVARQIAQRPGAAYFELSATAEPSSAWEAVLRASCAAFAHEVPDDCHLVELLQRHRSATARKGVPLVVFDNVDARPPFALEDLVPADRSFACVLVGPGAGELPDRVDLAVPDDEEFVGIATAHLPAGAVVSPAARATLLRIAQLSDHSALAARYVGVSDPAFLESDLTGFEQALAAADGLGFEARIQAAFQKCWAALEPVERQRVTFVAATGEPEVPLDWLPPALVGGPGRGWRMLADTGVAQREAGPDRLRAHRLFAIGAMEQHTEGGAEHAVAALVAWTRDAALSAELKMDGPRQRAFVGLYRYARREHALPADAENDLLDAFLDCSRSSRSDRRRLEELLSELWPEGARAASLSPTIAARLLDLVAPHHAKKSGALNAWRARALSVARDYVELTAEPIQGVPPSVERADVHRHYAKAIARDDPRRAADILRPLVAYCVGAARVDVGSEWTAQAAKAAIQLMKLLKDDPRAAAEAGVAQLGLHPERLPSYLRLSLMRAVLAVKDPPTDLLPADAQLRIAREGLTLCDEPGNAEVRGEFLNAMLRIIEVQGEYSLYPEVRRSVAAIMDDYERQGGVFSIHRFAAGHVVVKAAGMGVGAKEHEDVCRIVRLYALFPPPLSPFHLGRLAAAYREARLFPEAEALALAASAKEDNFDQAYELAKIKRWKGELADAKRRISELCGRGERLEALRDELAKVHAADGDIAAMRGVLAENVSAYRSSGREFFARRCEEWIAQLPESALSVDGARQDEWRSLRRREAVDAHRLRLLDDEMRQSVTRFVN